MVRATVPDLSALAVPGARIAVRVTPRAAAEGVSAGPDGVLHVRVTAPPADGRANDAVRVLVARALGVAPSRLRLIRGEKGRDKVLALDP